ncbi:RING-H2 finger protein ATL64-like [Rutidosis leptorrhynchoides]|uniref:RING-H2 finger protein ATL64-like n=1 Tax=Rutidosis leptorrhynchoides TaxID=125765 RepID=UPI003A998A77
MVDSNVHDSSTVNVESNIMMMSIIAFFIAIVFCFLLYYFSKRGIQTTPRESNNPVSEQKRGLDALFLDKIKVIEYDPNEFKGGLECAVCLSDVEKGEKARILPKCDHGFHLECIDTWFLSHTTCPICRNAVNDQMELVLELEQEDLIHVLLEEDEDNHHHQDSASEQESSSTSSSSSMKNGEKPDLVIDIPRRDVLEEEEEKTPVSSSRMRSLRRMLSGSSRFNPFSPSSESQVKTQ